MKFIIKTNVGEELRTIGEYDGYELAWSAMLILELIIQSGTTLYVYHDDRMIIVWTKP